MLHVPSLGRRTSGPQPSAGALQQRLTAPAPQRGCDREGRPGRGKATLVALDGTTALRGHGRTEDACLRDLLGPEAS